MGLAPQQCPTNVPCSRRWGTPEHRNIVEKRVKQPGNSGLERFLMGESQISGKCPMKFFSWCIWGTCPATTRPEFA